MIVVFSIKVRDIIHIGIDKLELPPERLPLPFIFDGTALRAAENQEKIIHIKLLVRKGDPKLQTFTFREIYTRFKAPNTVCQGNPNSKIANFYKKDAFSSRMNVLKSFDARPPYIQQAIFPSIPLNEHQYFTLRAISQSDTESIVLGGLTTAAKVVLRLNIVRHESGGKEW